MNSYENFEPIHVPTFESVTSRLAYAINLNTDGLEYEATQILVTLVLEMEPHIGDFEKEWVKVLLYLALVDTGNLYTGYLRAALGKYIDSIENLEFPQPWCQLYYRVLNSLIVDA